MSYIITHQNHPELVEPYKGAFNSKYGIGLDIFYDKNNYTYHFPFPIDSIINAHFEQYNTHKEVYFISFLIERELFSMSHAYGDRLEAQFNEFKLLIESLGQFFKKENNHAIFNTIWVHLLNHAQQYTLNYLDLFIKAGEININQTLSFSPYHFLVDSEIFGFTPLMVAKSKKFMQYLIEHGATLDTKSNPLQDYPQYEAYFKDKYFGFYKKLGKATYSKRHEKTALELAIIEKKKYAIDLLQEKMQEQNSHLDIQVNDIFQQNYDQIVASKKLVSRFNLAIREIKANNPILLNSLKEDEFKEMLLFTDKNGRDFLSYTIKYKSHLYLEKLLKMPLILKMAQEKNFKLNTHHEYLNDAVINGNKKSVELIYQYHFYAMDNQELMKLMFYSDLPHLVKDIYLKDKKTFILEVMLKPSYFNLLKEVINDQVLTDELIQSAIINLSLCLLNQSIQVPLYVNYKLDKKYYKSLFTLLHAYSETHIVDSFVLGLKHHLKTRHFSDRYIDSVQKTLFEFFEALTEEFPKIKKEAFEKLKDIHINNPYFIAYEKEYLDNLLSIEKDSKKGKSKI